MVERPKEFLKINQILLYFEVKEYPFVQKKENS